ncbi:MAG: NAD-dependent epimerase/dehydratase family protein, partial [Chloroflexi bacterium]|nr:NAD-dependent epimerase/dehydratase family protein [Chloroflexota bacterium]
RQDPFGEAGVVAIFAKAMMRGQRPTIFGDGSHERDYVYVDDVVQANVLAFGQDADGVYNIGTGEGTTVSQVFDAVAGATDYGGSAEHAVERPGDVHRIYLDVRRAERELGWRAVVSLEEGIRRTVDAMREAEAGEE